MPETYGHYSYWCPVDNHDVDSSPRLFLTKRGATNSLSAWLRGIWGKEQYVDSDGWEYPSYLVDTEPLVKQHPKIPRIKSEMKIVTLSLLEIEDGHTR